MLRESTFPSSDVHNMRARSREVHTAYGPLTLLPHKTRVRHKKQAQVQNIQQNEFKRGPGRVQAHSESLGGVQAVQGVQAGAGGVQGIDSLLQRGSATRLYVKTNGSRYPPSAHAAAFPHDFKPASPTSPWLFTKSQVKSFQNHLPS